MEKNKELGKNILVFGFGTFGAKLVQFVLIPIYTLYLTTSDYSTSDLVHSTVTMAMPFFTLGLGHGILRFALGNKKCGETLLRFSIIVSLIGMVVLFSFLPFFRWLGIFGGKEYYIPIMFIVGALSHIFASYCKALEKNVAYALNGIITAFTSAFFSWLLIVPFGMGVDGYLMASVFSSTISVLYLVIVCNVIPSVSKSTRDVVIVRDTLKYSIPLMPNDLAWWIIQMSDRYMVTFICGAAVNGIYTMAYKIPGIFNILVSVFISAFSITAFKEIDANSREGKADGKYFESLYVNYLAVSFITVAAVILMTQPVAYFLIQKDFYDSWQYTPFLLIAFVIGNMEAFLGSILAGMKKTKISFYSTFAGAVTNVVLNFFLIPTIKVSGAIFATIVGYFVVYLIRMWGVRKYVNMNLFLWKTVLSLTIISVMAFCYISRNMSLRLVSVVMAVVTIIVYWNNFLTMIKFAFTYLRRIVNKA